MEKSPHDVAWAGDDGRHQVERVEHQGQVFVIHTAQVLVAGQQEPTTQQGGFGQDQSGAYGLSNSRVRR